MSESLYAVFESTRHGERLRGIFPPTDGGCERALEWGDEQFDRFHAADPETREVGNAYLKKCHGVHIDRLTDD